MSDQFKIYVDRLRNGETESLDIISTPDFLEINEKELKFSDPVEVSGQAYQADGELVINLQISTVARLPCSMCNQEVVHPIEINSMYFTKPLSEIHSHIFDFSEAVREAVLLEVPFIVECNGGDCPSRKDIQKFLAPPKQTEDDGWQPFKDL